MSGAGTNVRPFPFAALESLTRADVNAAARVRRAARELAPLAKVERAIEELVDSAVSITAHPIRRPLAVRGADDAIGVLVAPSGERATSRRILVEVDGALGVALVTRALRQRAPRIVDPSRGASPAVAGAFAAVVLAVLRRVHAGAPMKVLAAGPAADLERDLRNAERDLTTASFAVNVGGDTYEARVTVPDAAASAFSRAPATLSRDALLAMGDAAIALPLLVTSTLATRADVDALAFGDVFVPTSLPLRVGAAGELSGAVTLIAPSSEHGLACDLAGDGRLVVRDRLDSHAMEIVMPAADSADSSSTRTTTTAALEDAPVVVRVELGTVEMKAREWAELGPGDVITLGRRVGDPAVLRVGGVELARGELVQVDGEYGVRILTRSPHARSAGDT